MKFIVPLSLAIVLLFSCIRVPVSNRRQMNLLNEKQLIEMAELQYSAFKDSVKVLPYTNSKAKRVKNIGEKIQFSVEKFLTEKGYEKRIQGFKWEFITVENKQLNAWCMPGGKVCFYTGILDIMDSDDEIAVVMGHEIAHAIARHGNERMSQQMTLAGLVNLSGSGASDSTETINIYQRVFMGSATLGMLKFSRMHETESDKLGLVFMKLAGYNPEKAIGFWEKMAAQGGFVPEIISTHPSDQRRISDIKEFLKDIDSYIQ